MSIFLYEPFYELDRLLDDGLGTSNSVQRRGTSDNNTGAIKSLKPRMDLHENSKDNIVTATFELPGLKKDDVDIDVNNNRMTVSGESKLSSEYDDSGYAVRERRVGKFSRTLQLPQGVKEDQIKANLDNGVLTVTFPKGSKEKAPKKITIN